MRVAICRNPIPTMGNALPSTMSAGDAVLARSRGQVFHMCSRKNMKPVKGTRKKPNCTIIAGTAKSVPVACG